MHLERYGRGSLPVLALHGWGGDHREFARIASCLAGEIELWCPDLPGYGRSPPPPAYDLDGISRSILRAWQAARPGRAAVAGFCSGALFALRIAQLAPEQAGALVLIDPFAYMPWYFRIFTRGAFGRRAYETAFVRPGGRRVLNGILRRAQKSGEDFAAPFARLDPDVVLGYLGLFARLGNAEGFRGVAVPAVVAHGERTFSAVLRSVKQYERLLPRSRVVTLPGVGHLPLVRGARPLAGLIEEAARSAASACPALSDSLSQHVG